MKSLTWKIFGLIGAVGLVIVLVYNIPIRDKSIITNIETNKKEGIENGIHVLSGLKASANYELVVSNCTSCHSAKLITQNRMSKNQWNRTIKWMQETQNLWDLGDNQEKIVNYLVENYPIVNSGRRANLTIIEWYNLKD